MESTASEQPSSVPVGDGNVPSPPRERSAWLLAGALALLGAAALTAALLIGRGSRPHSAPPSVVIIAATPAPGPAASASALAGVTKGSASRPTAAGASTARPVAVEPGSAGAPSDVVDATQQHISKRWMEGFYPIYATAQSTFGVNWLLIASIHRQESAFSTAPGVYHGLNFAGCCGGPMQFNVTNGPITTWALVSDSYRYGRRPAAYDHATAQHPSIYDDFDSIMAAAHLLSADGATSALDGTAWAAAFDYYGHDATGVSYADEVLARAISWSQHGFCVNCGLNTTMVEAVHAAYGAPVLAALTQASVAPAKPPAKQPSRAKNTTRRK